MREVPLDLWALGISLLLTLSIQILALSPMIEWMGAYFDRIGLQYESEADLYGSFIGGMLASSIPVLGLIVLAAVRRRQTGRA